MTAARKTDFRAPQSRTPQRLDTLIVAAIPELSRSRVKTLIEQGHVKVEGKTAAKAGLSIEPGELVQVEVPAPRKLDLTPREVGIRILYEDDSLAVLAKPAGVSVHPSLTDDGPTVVHGLLLKLKSLSSVGGAERPGIVHRIDKGTSGVLVVSKTDAAHLALSAQFKAHTIERRYQALVYGVVENGGRIESLIGRSPTNRKKMSTKVKTGRTAITHYAPLERLGPLTLVECRLETGRTHQIRVHLSEAGFPLVGDPLYGDNERKARALQKARPELARACTHLAHQLLHAIRLGFLHPATQKKLEFEEPLPDDFKLVLELARGEA